MKKIMRHATATVLPIVTAKAVNESKRAWRLFQKRLREVREERRESA